MKKDLLIFLQIVSIIVVSKNSIRKIDIPILYSKYWLNKSSARLDTSPIKLDIHTSDSYQSTMKLDKSPSILDV